MHTWTQSEQTSDTARILQLEDHQSVQAVTVHSILEYKSLNSFSSNLGQRVSIADLILTVTSLHFSFILIFIFWFCCFCLSFLLIDSSVFWWHLGKEPPSRINIPRPDQFSKALYIFDIGQNDIGYGFQHMTEGQIRTSIPDILNQFSQAVRVSDPDYVFCLLTSISKF